MVTYLSFALKNKYDLVTTAVYSSTGSISLSKFVVRVLQGWKASFEERAAREKGTKTLPMRCTHACTLHLAVRDALPAPALVDGLVGKDAGVERAAVNADAED